MDKTETSMIQDISTLTHEIPPQDGPGVVERKKNNQGSHECEVLAPGSEAAESTRAWRHCLKNPGHEKFSPVSEFSLDHLPLRHRRESILTRIWAVSDTTARLRVSYTSRGRPDGYPFCEYKGSTLPHYGSGWVHDVYTGEGTCPCVDCSLNSSPCQEWYEIHVVTACHVVYDSDEALSTTVEFFYDDETSREEGRVETLTGSKVGWRYEDDDYYMFTCATHNGELYTRLKNAVRSRGFRVEYPWLWFNERKLSTAAREENVVVVVSHPHGHPKRITVGEWSRPWSGDGSAAEQRFQYTAASCPGSSGAPVFLLKLTSGGLGLIPHSGFNQEEKLNFSATTFF